MLMFWNESKEETKDVEPNEMPTAAESQTQSDLKVVQRTQEFVDFLLGRIAESIKKSTSKGSYSAVYYPLNNQVAYYDSLIINKARVEVMEKLTSLGYKVSHI